MNRTFSAMLVIAFLSAGLTWFAVSGDADGVAPAVSSAAGPAAP